MSKCYCCDLDKFQSHDIFDKCMLLYVRVTLFFVWSLSNLKTVLATHTIALEIHINFKFSQINEQ